MNKQKILKSSGVSLLMGDEAVVRGALEAGVGFVSTYPGTPATEIGDTFSAIAKDAGIYFEYSTNEKIALEAAIGASLCGCRSFVSFKHFGLNVASDSLLPAAYIEPIGGFVVAVSDDPQCWSSIQSEQDSRHYAAMGKFPVIEPADPQEAKDLTKYCFELSEKFKTPVILRLTTRVAHISAPVELKPCPKPMLTGDFKKDLEKFNIFKPRIVELHKKLLEKIEKISDEFEKSPLNFVANNVKSEFGIICSGVSFCHVMEIVKKIDLQIPVLKLGTTFPVPRKLVAKFLKNKKRVLVIEELDPFVENQIALIARNDAKCQIFGKNVVPQFGELNPVIVQEAICSTFKIKELKNKPTGFLGFARNDSAENLPRRFPVFCPGCPHRATFYSIKEAAPDATFGGDIGCYMMGMFPPFFTQDFQYAMGAGTGISHGINKIFQLNNSTKKNIAFIGDATFFHAGIPALINAVHNKANLLLVIMDNSITAMTGLQPNPGTDKTGMGEPTSKTSVEEIVKACGVNSLEISDAYNLKQTQAAIQAQLEKPGVNVLLVRRKCALLMLKESRQQGIKRPTFQVDQSQCENCGTCYSKFSCPAIKYEDGKVEIDQTMCVGCAVCAQICSAIKIVK